MEIKTIFRNKPSPHYEDWVILDDNEIPSLQEINKKLEKYNKEK